MQHDHLAFMTSDSKATHDFYVDVIGWPLVVAWGDAEFSPPFFITGYDAGHFKLEFEEQVGVAPAAPAAEPFPHFGMLVSNKDEIEEWRTRLKAKGVRYVDHGSEIWFSDPNGIRFQVFYKDGAGDTPEDILERSKASLAEWLARPRK